MDHHVPQRVATGALIAAISLVAAILVLPSPARAQTAHAIGHLDVVEGATGAGNVRAAGWAADQDDPDAAVSVDIHVDGEYLLTDQTEFERPDVQRIHPWARTNTGFDVTFDVAPGSHTVCAYAVKPGIAATWLGCRSITIGGGEAPVGHLDSADEVDGESIRATGWAGDRDDPDRTVTVDLYSDGDFVASTDATGARPDVEAAIPALDRTTGFDVTFDVAPGTHSVCAFAIGEATPNTWLGCRTVSVAAGETPIGHLDLVGPVQGDAVRAAGWAADPGQPERTVRVDLYANGAYVATADASRSRPDVGEVFPQLDATTGFDIVVDLPAGTHSVCAYAIGQAAPNQLLGCGSVQLTR